MESNQKKNQESLVAVVEVFDTERSLGEGTVWCPLNQQLLWCDIVRGKIFVYDYVTKTNIHLDMRQSVGTVAPYTKKSCIAALMKGICEVDTHSGEIL